MNRSETSIWQAGASDAPLPPLVTESAGQQTEAHYLALYHQWGPIYRLARPGEKPLTILAGAEANAFTSRHGDEFFVSAELWKSFNEATGGIVGGMATMRDGAVNRQRRARNSRTYARTTVLDDLPRMVEITRQHAQWQIGERINLLPAMQRIVAEQLGQIMVNYSVGDYLEDLVLYLSTSIVSSFGSQNRDGLTSPRFQQAKARVFELGQRIVEEHRATPPGERKADLVDTALERAAAHPEQYTADRLAFTALGPLLAGLETVARTNTYLLYALLINADVRQRVITEVNAAFAQGPLIWERLKSMVDTQGAAMETLRLYTGGGFGGIVAQPLTFAGYRLEPGDEVLVAMTVPHHLAELFPQPESFDIDRYREPRNEHRQRGAYAPFGLGEHTCLGAGIAEIQLMLITATLLHNYSFELDPPDYRLSPEQQLSIADDAAGTSDKQQLMLKVTSKR